MGAHSFVINHLVMFHNKKLHTLVGYIVCIHKHKDYWSTLWAWWQIGEIYFMLAKEECIFLFIFLFLALDELQFIYCYLLSWLFFMGCFASFYFKELANNWMINLLVRFLNLNIFNSRSYFYAILFWYEN